MKFWAIFKSFNLNDSWRKSDSKFEFWVAVDPQILNLCLSGSYLDIKGRVTIRDCDDVRVTSDRKFGPRLKWYRLETPEINKKRKPRVLQAGVLLFMQIESRPGRLVEMIPEVRSSLRHPELFLVALSCLLVCPIVGSQSSDLSFRLADRVSRVLEIKCWKSVFLKSALRSHNW